MSETTTTAAPVDTDPPVNPQVTSTANTGVGNTDPLAGKPEVKAEVKPEVKAEVTEGNPLGLTNEEKAEQTPEEKKAADDAAAAKAVEDAKSKPPEKYEFKAADGQTLNEEQVALFEPVARDLGLTQEQADKLVALQSQFVAGQEKVVADHWNGVWKGWAEQTRADKEIRGDNIEKNLGIAKLALDKVGTPALKEVLAKTGMSNHPEIVRLLLRVGSTLTEDTISPSHGGGAAPKDAAATFFPDLPRAR